MPSRDITASWCFFRGSHKVRDAIKFMMKRRGMTAKALCEKVGVAPYRFSLYMNDRIPNLNQYQLYQICQELGIKVDINVEMREL